MCNCTTRTTAYAAAAELPTMAAAGPGGCRRSEDGEASHRQRRQLRQFDFDGHTIITYYSVGVKNCLVYHFWGKMHQKEGKFEKYRVCQNELYIV